MENDMFVEDDFGRWPNLRHFNTTEEFEAMLQAQGVDMRFSTKHPVASFPRFGDMEEEIARAKEMAERDGYC